MPGTGSFGIGRERRKPSRADPEKRPDRYFAAASGGQEMPQSSNPRQYRSLGEATSDARGDGSHSIKDSDWATLPAAIGEHLGVGERDSVGFGIDEDEVVRVRPDAAPTRAQLHDVACALPPGSARHTKRVGTSRATVADAR